jgi:hypothetical protein
MKRRAFSMPFIMKGMLLLLFWLLAPGFWLLPLFLNPLAWGDDGGEVVCEAAGVLVQ